MRWSGYQFSSARRFAKKYKNKCPMNSSIVHFRLWTKAHLARLISRRVCFRLGGPRSTYDHSILSFSALQLLVQLSIQVIREVLRLRKKQLNILICKSDHPKNFEQYQAFFSGWVRDSSTGVGDNGPISCQNNHSVFRCIRWLVCKVKNADKQRHQSSIIPRPPQYP